MKDLPIISVHNLTKTFGDVTALKSVNLDIYSGRIVGLLGANAAGKSTLLRHLVGLYLADNGTCTTFGIEAKDLGAKELARIGYVHQEGELINWMRVSNLIRFVSAHYPNWNTELETKFMKDFELTPNSKVGKLSPGQRQKLAILIAIGFEPELLILDEPVAALDPIMRQQFLDLLMEYIQEPGRTIIISSHNLSDVEKIIDHVIIMNKGFILRDCSMDDLREEFCRVRLVSLAADLPVELPFQNILDMEKEKSQAIITMKNPGPDIIEEKAREFNCYVEFMPLSLEDLYRIVMLHN